MKKSENYFSDFSLEQYNENKRIIDTIFLLALGIILILFIVMKDDFFN